VIAKLSRLRISGISKNTNFRELSTPELVIVFYELAEKWDVACCMPNCKKTKDRFRCVKSALRSMDAFHLQPSIKQVKAIRTDIKARKVCSRALEVMIENLETKYGIDLYTRTDWPKPVESPVTRHVPKPTLSTSSYSFSASNFGADDIPPTSSNAFPDHSYKENNPTPSIAGSVTPSIAGSIHTPSIADSMPSIPSPTLSAMSYSVPLHQIPQDAQNTFSLDRHASKQYTKKPEPLPHASDVVNLHRTKSPNSFFPMDREKEEKPAVNHMFSADVSTDQVGCKRLRRLSDHPLRKKSSFSTDSIQSYEEPGTSSKMQTSPRKPTGVSTMQTSPQKPSEAFSMQTSPQKPTLYTTNSEPFPSHTETSPTSDAHSKTTHQPPRKRKESFNQQQVEMTSNKFQENLDLIGKGLTQTIEVVGIDPTFLHSSYGPQVRRVLGVVFSRLQDYGVQEVESEKRLLWKTRKPIPKPRWMRLKLTVKEAATKIAKCVPSNFDSSLKKAIFNTAQHIDIQDHEF